MGILDKYGRDMRVTHQTNSSPESRKVIVGNARADNIFPDRVARTAMREGDLTLLDHDVKQLQKIAGFLGEQFGLNDDCFGSLIIK